MLYYLCLAFFSLAQFLFAQEYHHKKVAKNQKVPLSTISRHIDLKECKISIHTQLDSLYLNRAMVTWGVEVLESLPIQFYLHQSLTVDSVTCQGRKLNYQHSNDILLIDSLFPQGTYQKFSVYYHGKPEGIGFGSLGYIQDTAIWTLSEPYGAHTWFPNKEDLTDKIDSLDFELVVPEGFIAVANGIDLGSESLGNGNVCFRRKHKFPIAHYLIAFAVGKYHIQRFEFVHEQKTFPVVNYVYPWSDTLEARSNTERMISFFPYLFEKFGEYPFFPEQYGQAQFGWGGGMEHQTMTFLGNWWIELLIHELAHQWFGNLITCSTWKDLWLNEGFATYLSGLYYENIEPMWWKIFLQQRMKNVVSEPLGTVYANDTTEVFNLFSGRLRYNKGAMILHQLRFAIGDQAFFQALKNYLQDPVLRYRQATTQDLQRHFQSQTSYDVANYFQEWIYGDGFPDDELYWSPKNEGTLFRLKQISSNPAIPFFHVPIPIRIFQKNQVFDTILTFNHDFDYRFLVGIQPDSLHLDPDSWIIKGENSKVRRVEILESVFPNPFQHELRINTEIPIDIEIVDVAGRMVLKQYYYPMQRIETSEWSSGIYILRYGNERKKILKISE